MVPHLEPLEAWVVDETGWVKQGTHSVGVSHQYCGAVGKQANCQVSVEVVVSDGWVAAPIAGRLYLPQSWAEDPGRRAEVGVPAEVSFQTKPELTLDLVRQAQADGVPAAPLLGDAVYGDSPEFREGIRQLGMEFFLHVTPTHKAWTHPVSTQRKRTRHYLAEGVPPAQSLAEITAGFPPEQWKSCSWKAADRQRRRTRLAWCEVYLQHRLREGGENWKKLGWSWTGRSKRPNPITTTSPTFIASPHGPPASSSVAPAGTSNNTSNAPKTIWAWITLKGDRGAAFIIHLVLSALAYLFILTQHLRAKKTSGATWERILRAIQPWLVRASGYCSCCGAKFDRVSFDST